MSAENNSQAGKGKAFFDRADQVAETGNWDFAIEMYTEGLLREPDNLERGYKPMREAGFNRKASGGKGPGMREKSKHKTNSKDPAENLANAAYLLAKDPGSEQYMELVLNCAARAERKEVARWIAEILLESQRQSNKPNKRICVQLTDHCENLQMYDLAVAACGLAMQAAPNDAELEQRYGHLGAQYTLQKGRYGEDNKEFTDSVRDLDKQKELMQQDMLAKTGDALKQQILRARKDYAESPTETGKINALVDALLQVEDETHEEEAIKILTKAFEDTGAYQFKMRIGDIRIRQMARRFRQYRDAGDQENALKVAREQLAYEIKEYTERSKNYPTDLGMKYELGRRLFAAGKYDDAIGMLQQAKNDPRRFVNVMNYLGQAFMKKGWWQEAIDTFQNVMKRDLPEQHVKAVRYNLGTCYEQLGKDRNDVTELHRAEEEYSGVAQTDFNYKDVRQRLEEVRNLIREKSKSD